MSKPICSSAGARNATNWSLIRCDVQPRAASQNGTTTSWSAQSITTLCGWRRPSTGARATGVRAAGSLTARSSGGHLALNLRSSPGGPGGVRIEPDASIRLPAARSRDEVGPFGHLVLEPPDVGVLRRELDR